MPLDSLESPVEWPPLRLSDIKPIIRRLTETFGERLTYTLYVVTRKGQHQLYRGPVIEYKVERHVDSFTILLKGRVLFRVTSAPRPRSRPTDLLARLNEYRKWAGLDPVKHSPELSKGCDLHALYVVKNLPKG